MNNKKVSILIPIYGVENYIEQCAESLFHQSYSNIEYVFVNDCTKDNSLIILNEVIKSLNNEIRNRIKIINHVTNKGIAGTRNTLLENATGDFVYFLDSDDYIEINTIDTLVKEIEVNNSDIIFDSYKLVGKNVDLVREHKIVSKEIHLKNILFRRAYFNLWGNLYKKSLFDGLSFMEGHNFGEDFSIVPKLVDKANNISFTTYSFYNYRLLNNNSYTKNINEKSLDDILVAYQNLRDYFSPKSKEWNFLMDEAFYQLKAQLIKTTRGNYALLKCLKNKTKTFSKKYPNSILFKNNLLNFIFDTLI